MTKSTVTRKQLEILQLIYFYRFVDRIQIQAFMGHKDKRRIGIWLKDLRERHYLEWIYSTDLTEKAKPAIYYLGLNGIRFLKAMDSSEYTFDELRKRYRESSRRPDFIARSITIASACLCLDFGDISNTRYDFTLAAEYNNPSNPYYDLNELHPHLCFEKTNTDTDTVISTYLLEIFDPTLPRYMVKQRLKDYVLYVDDTSWEYLFTTKPIVLIACPSKAELIYAKRRTKTLLEQVVRTSDMHIRFATTEEMNQEGVTAAIWEEA